MNDVKGISLLSLNVRGIRNKRKRELVFKFLEKQGTDVIFLQETFFTKDLDDTVKREWNGITLHSFGSNHSRGVSILVKKNAQIPVNLIYSSDDGRILMINTEIDNKKVTLINIYAPTEK